VPNQHRIHQSRLFLAAQQRADTTLAAVVTTLTTLCRQVPGKRSVVLTADLTQTTAQDISAFISTAQASDSPPRLFIPKSGCWQVSLSICAKKAR
jgi:hypothetical protein